MRVAASGFGLIEGPVWHPQRGLYFSDLVNGGIHLLKEDGSLSTVLEKRRGIGGICLHENDGVIVSGRDVSFVGLSGQPGRQVLSSDVAPSVVGFNDLCADRQGRVYAGSLDYRVLAGEQPKPGRLYRIDLDGTARPVADDVKLNNGLAFSPDGRRLYHSDSGAKCVRVYDVGSNGDLSPWRSFATLDGEGFPDGLKVAADASVWVAVAHRGRVAVFEPDGRLRQSISLPEPEVTSLCFGGRDLRDLHVVTGSLEKGAKRGQVFVIRTEVSGLPGNLARVPLVDHSKE